MGVRRLVSTKILWFCQGRVYVNLPEGNYRVDVPWCANENLLYLVILTSLLHVVVQSFLWRRENLQNRGTPKSSMYGWNYIDGFPWAKPSSYWVTPHLWKLPYQPNQLVNQRSSSPKSIDLKHSPSHSTPEKKTARDPKYCGGVGG